MPEVYGVGRHNKLTKVNLCAVHIYEFSDFGDYKLYCDKMTTADRNQQISMETHLRAVPLFGQLKDSVLAGFAEYARMSLEKKGQVLFAPDSPNDKFYIVLSGWIKLYRETLSGEEAIVDVLTSGHNFGEIALPGTEGMPYGATVVEDAAIITIPRFLLAEEVMRNSLFGLSVLQGITRQKLQRDMEIEHRTVQNAPQRIGCFLLKLCNSVERGAVTLHLPYDKTVLALRLGMQPETFSRALTRLRDEAGIKIKGSSVDISDVQALVKYTCSACSSSFPCEDEV